MPNKNELAISFSGTPDTTPESVARVRVHKTGMSLPVRMVDHLATALHEIDAACHLSGEDLDHAAALLGGVHKFLGLEEPHAPEAVARLLDGIVEEYRRGPDGIPAIEPPLLANYTKREGRA